ncbi:(+)-neomenthol dehydrogenase-like [Lolium rigidum]|uniref:(+)-neomenthol dehydrogenase-like n=1 Tax=Lolium rigidum TaxID=89674 RepID=UPI001F5D2537|nr:(+)-neomenthol dehydrogenase-like [Lolium rigidum]
MEGTIPMSSNTRIAVVTGGSKGIGLEVCKQLAASGITVVLTARDETRGTAAVEQIKQLGHSDVIFHQLDITDASSVTRLSDFLKSRFGKLDILVNNAATDGIEHVIDPVYGVMPGGETFDGMDAHQRTVWMWSTCRETHEKAKQGVQTNYYGTKRVTEALLPLLQSSSDGRIVNVSSNFGLLRLFRSEDLKNELNNINNLTEERLDELLDMFLKDFEAGAVDARGWPAEFSAYKVAKAAMNAYSRILAKRHPELRINCAHPGYVRTDITRNSGILTPEEGARNITSVVLLPEDGPTGAYFHEGPQASFV